MKHYRAFVYYMKHYCPYSGACFAGLRLLYDTVTHDMYCTVGEREMRKHKPRGFYYECRRLGVAKP